MPLSELYRLARGGLESSQQKPNSSSTDLSHLPGNDEFVELVCENGQIMMEGQSSRVRRNTNFNNFQSQILKPHDRDVGNATNQKTGRYGLMGSALDYFTATVPSPNLGLDQDDEMTLWLGYNDHLQNNYCSDFLPEKSAVTLHDVPHQNNMALTGKKSFFHSIFDGNLPFVPPRRSGVSSITSNTTEYMGPSAPQASSCGFSNTSSGIINFSHFSRPVALACADLRDINTVAPASSLANDKIGLVNKGNGVSVNNEMGSHSQPNLLLKRLNTRNSENHGTVSREDDVNNAVAPHQVDGAVANKETQEGEKIVEPVVASSSVCSGNNPEPTSDDQNHDLRRKNRETDDSEGRSEDVEEESVGLRKAVPSRGGTGTKRSRAAEVHNLSERRRRDRINEKMRALQELIPNCNKVDKASMLDEAIEYLKTLQLQVQIMSMGAGLYMPHMMLPGGMQHVPGHMAHYSPMMGMGYGMGMVDMNGGARFHGPRGLPFPGPTNFQMMAGSNLPVIGSGHHVAASHHPSGLGIPVSQPCQPSVPISAGITIPSVNNVFGVTAHMEISAPTDLINNRPGHSPLACNNDKAPDYVKDVLPR